MVKKAPAADQKRERFISPTLIFSSSAGLTLSAVICGLSMLNSPEGTAGSNTDAPLERGLSDLEPAPILLPETQETLQRAPGSPVRIIKVPAAETAVPRAISSEAVTDLNKARTDYENKVGPMVDAANNAAEMLDSIACGNRPTESEMNIILTALNDSAADIESLRNTYQASWQECVDQFSALGEEAKAQLQKNWDLVSSVVAEELNLLDLLEKFKQEALTELEQALRARLEISNQVDDTADLTLAQVHEAQKKAEIQEIYASLSPYKTTIDVNIDQEVLNTWINEVCKSFDMGENGVFFYNKGEGWRFVSALDQCKGDINDLEYGHMIERIYTGTVDMKGEAPDYKLEVKVPGFREDGDYRLKLEVAGPRRLVATYDENLTTDSPGLVVEMVSGGLQFRIEEGAAVLPAGQLPLGEIINDNLNMDSEFIAVVNGTRLDPEKVTAFMEQ